MTYDLALNIIDSFRKNTEQCINTKLESEDKSETVVLCDRALSQHTHHIRGRLDKYLLVKEFCQRLNISSTLTEFTLSHLKRI